ncbi:MAG: DUF4123 domain-containing protein, partial [Burkholderiales bacterium]|nr:DUF4123 domain-containing protein [Burkholderiales bacterium]
LDWLSKQGSYSSSLIFFRSPQAIDKLTMRLQRRLQITLPDNIDAMLRFYDPRVFESLISSLTPQQRDRFLSIGSKWWWVDRCGHLHSIDSNFEECDSVNCIESLSKEQEAKLIDACEPDQVTDILRKNLPEHYLALSPSDRHPFVLRQMTAAKELGIHVTHELALFCGLSLLYGEDFTSESDWKAALTQVKDGKIRLTEATERVEGNEQEN